MEPTIKEGELLHFFTTMAEALDEVNKPPICVELQPLKSDLKPAGALSESLRNALWS